MRSIPGTTQGDRLPVFRLLMPEVAEAIVGRIIEAAAIALTCGCSSSSSHFVPGQPSRIIQNAIVA